MTLIIKQVELNKDGYLKVVNNVRRKWTQDEIEELKRDYKKYSNAELATRLGRTVEAMRKEAQYLGIAVRNRKWTQDEIEELKRDYKKYSNAELATRLGRTVPIIRTKARDLGIAKYDCKWTQEKIDLLNKLSEKHTNEKIAEILGLRCSQVICARSYNKIRKKSYEVRNLSDKQIAYRLSGTRWGKNSIFLAKIYLKYPNIIELKRNQILLDREIKRMNNE